VKLFHYSGNCHNKVLRASTRPSISLIVLLLATILINPSFASAEIKKECYPSGKLKSEINVVDGKPQGLGKMYYESGKLQPEGDILTFIEIKTRSSREYIPSEFAVTKHKQSKIKRSAAHYLGKHGIENRDCRFNITSIAMGKGHSSLYPKRFFVRTNIIITALR
tara:strand:- start:305 stop:799 length:495 start_codon:yes stop_codon:yes gene_type:complete